MPSLSSFEDMIGFHMIPINKYNLIDLSNKLLSNLYPLDVIFESSFLREYGTSITDIIFSAIIANIDSILSRIALEGTLMY